MFNIHLPHRLYESLPWIYLAVAGMLSLMPQMSTWRWVPIIALLLAYALTVRQRRRFRRPEADVSRTRSAGPVIETSVRDW
jgi:hypothetical protein